MAFRKVKNKGGNQVKWLGKIALHPKELSDLENIKNFVRSTNGENVIFELKDSPSSGEIFTMFKELHVYEGIESNEQPSEAVADKGLLTEEELNNRNRKLVHENDELLAEVERLKASINDIITHIGDITSKNYFGDAYIDIKQLAKKALEELK